MEVYFAVGLGIPLLLVFQGRRILGLDLDIANLFLSIGCDEDFIDLVHMRLLVSQLYVKLSEGSSICRLLLSWVGRC